MVVPAFASAHPVEFFAVMPSDQKDDLLTFLWRATESHSGPLPTHLDANSTSVTCCSIEGMPTVILELPTPHVISEAYFVALVSTKGLPNPQKPEDTDLRYITLELGKHYNGPPRTVLCEWRNGIHSIYEGSPNPTLEAFHDATREVLLQPPPSPSSVH